MEIKNWNTIEEERISEKITRKMFWGENVMVVKWELAPETSLPVHEHVSEQVTMVERGSVTLIFPSVKHVTVREGEMLVIPPSVPHGVEVGPEGATAVDLFSPIRRDFIEKTSSYLPGAKKPEELKEPGSSAGLSEEEQYALLHAFLVDGGIKVPLETLKKVPLEVVARYVYERECITMGQLREILGVDKKQAKELLRLWKHGDDHSESSLKRKMERLVIATREHHEPKTR